MDRNRVVQISCLKRGPRMLLSACGVMVTRSCGGPSAVEDTNAPVVQSVMMENELVKRERGRPRGSGGGKRSGEGAAARTRPKPLLQQSETKVVSSKGASTIQSNAPPHSDHWPILRARQYSKCGRRSIVVNTHVIFQ